eukprot:4398489-Amphidinium_carterae.1
MHVPILRRQALHVFCGKHTIGVESPGQQQSKVGQFVRHFAFSLVVVADAVGLEVGCTKRELP